MKFDEKDDILDPKLNSPILKAGDEMRREKVEEEMSNPNESCCVTREESKFNIFCSVPEKLKSLITERMSESLEESHIGKNSAKA